MLDAADVVVYAHPAVHRLLAKGQLVVVRVAIAKEVPARAGKGIHRIGFTSCFAVTVRTMTMYEFFSIFQRKL